ncbi:MAG: hypothetical protein QXN03_02730, partial [Desulfurococcaceae archaeon]
SRKNIHRYTYAKRRELIRLAREGYIFKRVDDYASSSKRRISVSYYTYDENNRTFTLKSEQGLRDERGFFDIVELPDGRKLRVMKDAIEQIT